MVKKNVKEKNSVSFIFLVVLFSFLLLLSSCMPFGNQRQTTIEDYRQGVSSIDISFIRGLPGQELLQDSRFSVGVVLHNKGASDVLNGRLVLTYDKEYFGFFSGTSRSFELLGRSSFLPQGEERSFFFEGETKSLGTESFTRDFRLTATACFEYETVFVGLVCLDRPFTNDLERGTAVCRVRDITSSGQGGPVFVSRVEYTAIENNLGVKPFFDITISHRGSGIVTHPDSYGVMCSSASSQGLINRIVVKKATLSEVELDCNERELQLRSDSVRLRCTTFSEIIPHRLPFEAPLKIELGYGYSLHSHVSTSIIS